MVRVERLLYVIPCVKNKTKTINTKKMLHKNASETNLISKVNTNSINL